MAAVGHDWGSEASYTHIERIAALQANEQVLTAQRDSLLTAGMDREAGDYREKEWDEPGPDFGKTMFRRKRPIMDKPKADAPFHDNWENCPTCQDKAKHGRMSANDARHVELEAAKFVANNPDVDRDELQIRAAHKAQVETSTFTPERSRAVTAAFVRRVAQLHRPAPRQRTAAITTPDCADEMMFVV
jgi:hypothetical protein